jgi:hypothetical protein
MDRSLAERLGMPPLVAGPAMAWPPPMDWPVLPDGPACS